MTRAEAAPREPVEQRTVDSITFSYPPADVRLTQDQLGPLCRLSAAHAVGEVVSLDPDLEAYPALGAVWVESPKQSVETMVGIGSIVSERFGDVVEEVLRDRRRREAMMHIGNLLEGGNNVIHALPHGSILDIGLGHGVPVVALTRLGFQFNSSVMISAGVTALGHKFQGVKVPLVNALSGGADKVLLTVPRTENVKKSDFAKAVPASQIDGINEIVVDEVADEQEEGGWLITLSPDATSYRKGPNGKNRLAVPGKGTLRVMAHPKTYVQAAAGRFVGTEHPTYDFFGGLHQLSMHRLMRHLQGDAIMLDMVDGLMEQTGDEFDYRPRHRLGVRVVRAFQSSS